MIPFGNNTVTLIKRHEAKVNGKTQVTYTKELLHNCSWRSKQASTTYDNSVIIGRSINCRVPAGQTKPAIGDALILGEYADTPQSAAEVGAIVESMSGDAFRVTAVADNTGTCIPFPHYLAQG